MRLAHRFRATIDFNGAAPWSELNRAGKTLRSSHVPLRIVRRTCRCPDTSADLARGVRDINVSSEAEHHLPDSKGVST